MRDKRGSVITGGTILAIGVTVALYKALTSKLVENAVAAIFISLAVAVGLAVLCGLAFAIVHIRYRHQRNETEIEARRAVIQAISNEQTNRSSNQEFPPMDQIYLGHMLAVLFGCADERKAIQKRRYMVAQRDKGTPYMVDEKSED